MLSMLATLNQGKKRQWSQHKVHLVHAYNSIKCDATGYSLYFLMFGWEARIYVLGHAQMEKPTKPYVTKIKEDLKKAYIMASEAS